MKKLVLVGLTILLVGKSYSQDTLKIDISKYKYIEIGEKLYKVNFTLDDITGSKNWWQTFGTGAITTTPYYLNDTLFTYKPIKKKK